MGSMDARLMNFKDYKKKTYGFTIVELLIVIVVIAILAAISIVAYNGIQARANNSAVASDAAMIHKKMELTRVDLGRYPITGAELPDLKVSKSAYDTTNQNVIYCYNGANDTYAVALIVKGRDKQYTVTKEGVTDTTTLQNTNGTCQIIGLAGWDSRTYGTVGRWSTTEAGTWLNFKWVNE